MLVELDKHLCSCPDSNASQNHQFEIHRYVPFPAPRSVAYKKGIEKDQTHRTLTIPHMLVFSSLSYRRVIIN